MIGETIGDVVWWGQDEGVCHVLAAFVITQADLGRGVTLADDDVGGEGFVDLGGHDFCQ